MKPCPRNHFPIVRNAKRDCVVCNRERAKEWRDRNPERSRANAKRWAQRNPDKVLAIQLRRYGLTLEQYQELLTACGGRCMICDSPPSGMQNSRSSLCVDHDAETGQVRGLLCGGCNVAIGHFKHDPRLLLSAERYLQKIASNGDVGYGGLI